MWIHKVDLTKDAGTLTKGAPLYPSLGLYPSLNLYPGGFAFIDTVDDNWFDPGGETPEPGWDIYSIESRIKLPKWYPHVGQEIGTPKDKILIKKVTIEGEGTFDAEVYRTDYNTTVRKSHEETSIQDLDLHVNSRVDRCDISIIDDTTADFRIKSLVIEGLFSPTSRTLK